MLVYSLLLVLLCASSVRATAPECAILFCGEGEACAQRFAVVWVEAAQEEAVRFYHTENGGFLAGDCTENRRPQRIEPFQIPVNDMLCLDHWDIPKEKCHTKRCDFNAHPELFESDCDNDDGKKPHGRRSKHSDDDDEDDGHGGHGGKKAACRTVASWAKIGSEKLAQSLNELEQGNNNTATSYACAADFIFSHINHWLIDSTPQAQQKLVFINDEARRVQSYRHINSKARRAVFSDIDLNAVIRAIQSVRSCDRGRKHMDTQLFQALTVIPGTDLNTSDPIFLNAVSSVIVYSFFNGTAQNVTPTTDLIWAPTGVLPPFAATLENTEPDNRCVRINADTNLEGFDPARRLPSLTGTDYAYVRDDGLPRVTRSLAPASSCPAIVLLHNMTTAKNSSSFAQVNLHNGPPPRQPANFSSLVEAGIYARAATEEECTDFEPIFFDAYPPADDNSTGNATVLGFQVPPRGIPLSLAPGESRCVGGERAGALCTMESECGAGRACRRKPGLGRDAAYCYDGERWEETQPCVFADEDEECPFGYCFGDVNGNPGGAYPLYYFYQQNNCARSGADNVVCAEQHVADWHQYPNEAAFV